MSGEKVRQKTFRVDGEALVAKVKELVHEGNIRRVVVKDKKGRTLIDVP